MIKAIQLTIYLPPRIVSLYTSDIFGVKLAHACSRIPFPRYAVKPDIQPEPPTNLVEALIPIDFWINLVLEPVGGVAAFLSFGH